MAGEAGREREEEKQRRAEGGECPGAPHASSRNGVSHAGQASEQPVNQAR